MRTRAHESFPPRSAALRNSGSQRQRRTSARGVMALLLTGVVLTAPVACISSGGASSGESRLPRSTGVTKNVFLPDNGSLVLLQHGDRLVIDLGADYEWNVASSDPSVLAPVQA